MKNLITTRCFPAAILALCAGHALAGGNPWLAAELHAQLPLGERLALAHVGDADGTVGRRLGLFPVAGMLPEFVLGLVSGLEDGRIVSTGEFFPGLAGFGVEQGCAPS